MGGGRERWEMKRGSIRVVGSKERRNEKSEEGAEGSDGERVSGKERGKGRRIKREVGRVAGSKESRKKE